MNRYFLRQHQGYAFMDESEKGDYIRYIDFECETKKLIHWCKTGGQVGADVSTLKMVEDILSQILESNKIKSETLK